jgi:predicted CoA-binding protein
MGAKEEKILKEYRTVAVVGASPNSERASYIVASYLLDHGYNIIPVNPKVSQIFGRTSYPDLSSIPEKVEVVDIFRKSEEIVPIVDEAIKIGAKAIWMQEGVINKEAAAKAKAGGLLTIMNKCMLKEHERLTNISNRKKEINSSVEITGG